MSGGIRQALNENRTVQLAVVGVLMVLAALMVMSGSLTGGGSTSEQSASPVSTLPGAASSSSGAAPGTGGITPVPAASTVTAKAFEPGPGLPGEVVAAHERGQTVVLLVVRAGGIDDRMVRGAVDRLRGDSRLAVFVTRADGIARYSRITQGVGVNQVPALVVISPQRKPGAAPEATVDYGFRSATSVVQAVRDAAYQGRNRGYDPG